MVFKTSANKMKLALDMNIEGSHFLAKEYGNLDGTQRSVFDFVMLTARVHHPLLKKQVVLASSLLYFGDYSKKHTKRCTETPLILTRLAFSSIWPVLVVAL